MMNDLTQQQVGSLTAENYRVATIFKKYGIDFCCNGGITVEAAAIKKGINLTTLANELKNELAAKPENNIDFKQWPLDLLVDYIEKKHHRYVREQIPAIGAFLNKLCKVHGERHPELFEINALFNASAIDLNAHLEKEEKILFPFIKKMVLAGGAVAVPFGTVENPVAMMMHEHDVEGERFRKIAALSSNYTAPVDACNTYRVTYGLLHDFENDLHHHIHLENNILFPAAIALEQGNNN